MSSILVTSAGKRVSLVKAFQTELQKLIPEAKVFTADASPGLSAACAFASNYFKVPRLDNPNYINELINKFDSMIFCSATLTTNDEFDYFILTLVMSI